MSIIRFREFEILARSELSEKRKRKKVYARTKRMLFILNPSNPIQLRNVKNFFLIITIDVSIDR